MTEAKRGKRLRTTVFSPEVARLFVSQLRSVLKVAMQSSNRCLKGFFYARSRRISET